MIWQNQTNVIGSLYNQVLTNPGDLNEYSMGSVTLPPGTLAPGKAIRVIGVWSTVLAGTCTAKLEIRLNGIGGTNICEGAFAAANGGHRGCDGLVVGLGANSQFIYPNLVAKHTYTDSLNGATNAETLDYTQEIDIEFILSLGVDSSGEATLHYGVVELL